MHKTVTLICQLNRNVKGNYRQWTVNANETDVRSVDEVLVRCLYTQFYNIPLHPQSPAPGLTFIIILLDTYVSITVKVGLRNFRPPFIFYVEILGHRYLLKWLCAARHLRPCSDNFFLLSNDK